ncbi:MAG: glycoside hydrolase domain-containing protein, partial [Gemmatimonadota bacterium]
LRVLRVLCVFAVSVAVPAKANGQTLQYSVGQWNPDSLGHHRVVVHVSDSANAVIADIPWRRRDPHPEQVEVTIASARTGAVVRNQFRLSITRERGILIFEPVSGPGDYYLYYLPYRGSIRSNYPRISYATPVDSADPAWRKTIGFGSEQGIGTGLPRARVLRIEASSEWDSFFPMEVIATRAETDALVAQVGNRPFLLFPEDRTRAVRMHHDLPARWIESGPNGPVTGSAQRGEWYAFQVGVYASKADLGPIAAKFSPLTGSAGATIPAAAFSCINLNGRDWRGHSFTREVRVSKGEIYPLWCGVQIPEGAPPGEYRGSMRVTSGAGRSQSLLVHLSVSPASAAHHGDDDPWRLSRLRWLNSTLEQDDGLVAPYTAIERKGLTLSLLGRDLTLGTNGLPTSLRSFFTPAMTGIGAEATELLRQPVRLVARNAHGKDLDWQGGVPTFVKQASGAVAWTTRSTAEGLLLVGKGQLDFDGTIEYSFALRATRNLNLADVRLDVPLDDQVARYVMGLNLRGSPRPPSYDWHWDVTRNQDAVWVGSVNAGLQLSLHDDKYVRPLNTNFYQQKPLVMPHSWSNGSRGGCHLGEEGTIIYRVSCFSGARTMRAGQVEHYDLRLVLTPFHPIDPAAQWKTRFFHAFVPLDSVARMGANTINVHHATAINPWINYPFLRPDTMRAYIKAAHDRGMKVKIYYTVRELTTRAPELWALRTLGDEVLADGPGGGWSWLQEHVEGSYLGGWFVPEIGDAALVTSGVSRWHNFYVEGLAWLAANVGIDGLYLDDVAFDRVTMKRVRKALLRNNPAALIDLHSANQYNPRDGFASSANLYLEHFPFIDRLWFGEYFNYDDPPATWLVEMSGIPFGLMGEMLEGNGNPWRGMVFGMTNRLPWSGDPRAIWREWDAFGIQDTRMLGWWLPDGPVRTGRDDLLATTYLGKGKALIALASWAKDSVSQSLQINWTALGIDSTRATIVAPAIDSFQPARQFKPGEPIPVAPGKGWLLELRNN